MECVVHVGYTDKDGYGKEYCSEARQQVSAHRNAYRKHHGLSWEAMRGKLIRHTCDNPPCKNAEHLIEGTQEQNMCDMYNRGRLGNRLGEANNQATLTDLEVAAIKHEYVRKWGEFTRLAKKYNTSRVTIANIIKGYYRNG